MKSLDLSLTTARYGLAACAVCQITCSRPNSRRVSWQINEARVIGRYRGGVGWYLPILPGVKNGRPPNLPPDQLRHGAGKNAAKFRSARDRAFEISPETGCDMGIRKHPRMRECFGEKRKTMERQNRQVLSWVKSRESCHGTDESGRGL